jgi:hypothetical protein
MNTKTNGAGVTLADLVINARLAAQNAFNITDPLARQTAKLEGFKAAGFESRDFPTWENAFYAELEMLTTFSRQPSPAAAAAAAKAQTPASGTES